MDAKLAQFIVDAVEYHGMQSAEVYKDYSGRGMMGKTTTGVVVDSPVSLASDLV